MPDSNALSDQGTEVPANARDPDRVLGLQGSPNFRDAGGYAAGGDGRMAWRRLFRSGHLALLTDDDFERLSALELELICDLRRIDERELEPSRLPDGLEVISANITPGSQSSAIYSDSAKVGGGTAMFEFMCDINREFVRSQTETYREVFSRILDSGATRVLFHCSAGKDRTGFAVAMMQLALGVPMREVHSDYLLSRQYYLPERELPRVRAKYRVDHLSDDELMPMLRRNWLTSSALLTISEGFGSVEQYLSEGLGLGGVERRELARRFLD